MSKITIVKRTDGCTENDSCQLEACIFSQRSENIECTLTGARHYISDSPQSGLKVPCTMRFSW